MIFSFLIIPLLIIFFYLSLKGLGYLFCQYFYKNNTIHQSIYPLAIMPAIFFLLTVIHFFTKISPYLNLILFAGGFIIYLTKIRKNENKLLYLIILVTITIQFMDMM